MNHAETPGFTYFCPVTSFFGQLLGETIAEVLLATGCHNRARKSRRRYYQCSCNNNIHLCYKKQKKCIHGCNVRNRNVTLILNLRPWCSFYHLDKKKLREVFNSRKPLMMPWAYETETICSGISFHIFQ